MLLGLISMVLKASAMTLVSLDWVLTQAATSLAGSFKRPWSMSEVALTLTAMLVTLVPKLTAENTTLLSTEVALEKAANCPEKTNLVVLATVVLAGRLPNAAATSSAVTLVCAVTTKPPTVTD